MVPGQKIPGGGKSMQKKEEMKDGREALTLQETQQIALAAGRR